HLDAYCHPGRSRPDNVVARKQVTSQFRLFSPRGRDLGDFKLFSSRPAFPLHRLLNYVMRSVKAPPSRGRGLQSERVVGTQVAHVEPGSVTSVLATCHLYAF